jgi:hypothetical protein
MTETTQATNTEITPEEPPNLSDIEANIRELEHKSASNTLWTSADTERLRKLRQRLESLKGTKKSELTSAHHAALARQSIAGVGDEPQLTPEESRLIREVNA